MQFHVFALGNVSDTVMSEVDLPEGHFEIEGSSKRSIKDKFDETSWSCSCLCSGHRGEYMTC